MKLVVLTPVRLLGDGLAVCLRPYAEATAVVSDLANLREVLARSEADLVLVDVTLGIELYDVRAIAAERPDVALVALGLSERRQDVIRCGRAGYSGYVSRDASVPALVQALSDAVEGRLACPAEISGGLLRALFRADAGSGDAASGHDSLTRRESDVLRLIGGGLTNKEIARELSLSIATVKHHVHHVLEKLRLARRAQAMRKVRDAPWLATPPEAPLQRKAHQK